MGHNILALAIKNPNSIFVGIDPFINGVANLVHTCVEEKISNILLYPTP
ncbi:MAG: tRNA (guanosine(46)-N7)-methyltransferase TrmB, partial [Proteobacteria bacterium]|nr:tRNA (guanosine(46)-N7)-methyltransferase TrmB [Pseudomonadota bacterium]